MPLDLDRFERDFNHQFNAFVERKENPTKRPQRKHIPSPSPIKGLEVTLAVNRRQLAPYEYFTHVVETISETMAVIEATKAARALGWEVRFTQDVKPYTGKNEVVKKL